MPTLTLQQLLFLGALTVAGSFTLNWFFLRNIFADFRQRLERIEGAVTDGETGLVVRVVKLETINKERRGDLPGRRFDDMRQGR